MSLPARADNRPPRGLAYSERALKSLERLPLRFRQQIIAKIDALQTTQFPAGAKALKGMMWGEERVWRIRSGDYRVLYVVREAAVVVLDIDHRKDVYRPG